jgi:CHAT domain-containing protein
VRQTINLTVTNALLQLKANQFLSTQGNRLVTFRDWEWVDKGLFRANRRFAAAARRVAADRDVVNAALELDDALFAREQLEAWMVANAFEMAPEFARAFHYNFLELSARFHPGSTLIDYSLVRVRPPKRGMLGPTTGWRYVGIKLSKDDLIVEDLGPEEDVNELCLKLAAEIARNPSEAPLSTPRSPGDAEEQPAGDAAIVKPHDDLFVLAEQVYQRVLKPLEPLGNSIVIAPDGALASLAFHALVRDGRYLVEDIDISYCHSLLQEEGVVRRQSTTGMRLSIDLAGANDIVLVGDPDYSEGCATPLPNTRVEVEAIARQIVCQGWREQYVHQCLGPKATASQLTTFAHLHILHLAAHGAYLPPWTNLPQEFISANDHSWSRWDEENAAALCELDQALLRAVLVLSPEDTPHVDPEGGRLVTALEFSSLNLIACRLAVLSACESGIGQPERGAGVLGFQFALLMSFAHAGLVSLWSVPDLETSDLMDWFYDRFTRDYRNVRSAYMATLRHFCRREGEMSHPYFWASFVLLGAINR